MESVFEPRQLALAREKLPEDKLEHSVRVGTLAGRQGSEYATAGLFHDMFEDSDVTESDLRTVGVTDHELAAIRLATHGPESYDDCIARIADSGDRLAISVKICDLLDHLDPSLSRGLDDAKIAKNLGALPSLVEALHALNRTET